MCEGEAAVHQEAAQLRGPGVEVVVSAQGAGCSKTHTQREREKDLTAREETSGITSLRLDGSENNRLLCEVRSQVSDSSRFYFRLVWKQEGEQVWVTAQNPPSFLCQQIQTTDWSRQWFPSDWSRQWFPSDSSESLTVGPESRLELILLEQDLVHRLLDGGEVEVRLRDEDAGVCEIHLGGGQIKLQTFPGKEQKTSRWNKDKETHLEHLFSKQMIPHFPLHIPVDQITLQEEKPVTNQQRG